MTPCNGLINDLEKQFDLAISMVEKQGRIYPDELKITDAAKEFTISLPFKNVMKLILLAMDTGLDPESFKETVLKGKKRS